MVMRYATKKNDGFGLIAVIAVLAVVAAISTSGWLVYKSHKTTTVSSGATSSKSKGYKRLLLRVEKLKLKYPSDWVVQNRSTSTCDKVNLHDKTTDLYLKINTCASITSSVPSAGYFKAHHPEHIRTLGKDYYLDYSMMFEDQTVQAATVSASKETASQYPPSQHTTVEEKFEGSPGISISIIYGVTLPEENLYMTLADFKGTTSFGKAIKVIESITYQ